MNNKLSNQQKGSLLAFIGVFLITPDSLLNKVIEHRDLGDAIL